MEIPNDGLGSVAASIILLPEGPLSGRNRTLGFAVKLSALRFIANETNQHFVAGFQNGETTGIHTGLIH